MDDYGSGNGLLLWSMAMARRVAVPLQYEIDFIFDLDGPGRVVAIKPMPNLHWP